MTIAIIGIGLIGGSMAISLKENGFADKIIGVDKISDNLDKALRRKLIDEALPLATAIEQADIIIMAIPVDALETLLPKILDQVDQQIVMDVGSTKWVLAKAIENHPKRKNYVATHPMAGTENSGPEAAQPDLFLGKCNVICDQEKSGTDALAQVKKLYESLQMSIVYLDSKSHDVHTAYVSHISHISSFALALTVLEKEKDEKRIFELASGGFGSTVRLAKSSADMWIPIFEQNKENVLDVLDEHINTLAKFRTLIIKNDFSTFHQLIEKSNHIRKIIK